jgi:hypothetical protein
MASDVGGVLMVTEPELNRATLARQLLLERAASDIPTVIKRIVALQAQSPASPYIALFNRVADLAPADVDDAFDDATAVKAALMRITLHAVHRDDYPLFHQAMQPTLRAARLADRRFTETGLTADDADAWLPEVVDFLVVPRTNAEVDAWLDERGLPPRLWWALRHYAPVRHAVTGPPWSFGVRPTYVAAALEPPVPGDSAAADTALEHLLVRYLEGFGPASVADMAQFALVPRGRVRTALRRLDDRLEHLQGPGGADLFDVPGAPRPPGDVPAPPRLLGMWDSVLLAHHDRSRVVADDHRRVVIRRNGDVLPTLLVDGVVAGVWRARGGAIEAATFRPLPDAAREGLAAEASSLLGMLERRDPEPYRRHDHWWDRLPGLHARRLAP